MHVVVHASVHNRYLDTSNRTTLW